MTCPNIEWIEKYGTKCTKTNNGYKCENINKIRNICSKCNFYHIIKCHGTYYAIPCMYPCGSDTGLYRMCPHLEESKPTRCYKIIGYYQF